MTKFFRLIADTFFVNRYGHRAVVLETVAGVPGMVAGVLMHFKSLRSMKTGYGENIREMLAEAENERMHLMFFIEIAKPNRFERILVLFAQILFGVFYLCNCIRMNFTFLHPSRAKRPFLRSTRAAQKRFFSKSTISRGRGAIFGSKPSVFSAFFRPNGAEARYGL